MPVGAGLKCTRQSEKTLPGGHPRRASKGRDASFTTLRMASYSCGKLSTPPAIPSTLPRHWPNCVGRAQSPRGALPARYCNRNITAISLARATPHRRGHPISLQTVSYGFGRPSAGHAIRSTSDLPPISPARWRPSPMRPPRRVHPRRGGGTGAGRRDLCPGGRNQRFREPLGGAGRSASRAWVMKRYSAIQICCRSRSDRRRSSAARSWTPYRSARPAWGHP